MDSQIPNVKKTYTCQEVAAILGISVRSVYRLLESENKIKSVKVGKLIRISKPSFDSWMSNFN